jgi:hypothetical protein
VLVVSAATAAIGAPLVWRVGTMLDRATRAPSAEDETRTVVDGVALAPPLLVDP